MTDDDHSAPVPDSALPPPSLEASEVLSERVRRAAHERATLAIRGHGTKRFYTGAPAGTPLDVTGHRGIVSYEPTELVLTARAGTQLREIEATLAQHNQMLAFEPPYFGEAATLGGTIACGFSGPRRPYAGSARDFVLGVRIINGQGEILKFGGQVMKNVAGYDVSRLMVGSLGSLGVILEVSLKVLPRPAVELTLAFEMGAAAAIQKMNAWAGQPLPLSGAAHLGETLYIRLSGAASAVAAARAKLGGELLEKGAVFWEELREHRRVFFQDDAPLWRLSVPPATAPLDLPGAWLLDWGGAQRWLKSDAGGEPMARALRAVGGHARLFRGTARGETALPAGAPALAPLWQRLRLAFDPSGVLNPGLAPA